MSRPDERFVLSTVLGRWQTNCYVIGDRSSETAVVVDPGEHGERFVGGLLDRLGVRAEQILLTHGHIDHLWAVPALARELDVPVLLHDEDRWLWENPAAAFGAPFEVLEREFGLHWDPPTDRLESVRDGQRIFAAGTTLTVRHNPGHTPGHVTYLASGMDGAAVTLEVTSDDAEDGAAGRESAGGTRMLFSGDLVFAGSIGRTDFPRGDTGQIMRSLVDTVLVLEDDTLVLPGHGPETTVGRERATNPFLHQAASFGA